METELREPPDPREVLKTAETELAGIECELESLVRNDELLSGLETVSREGVEDLVDVRFGRKITLTLLKNDASRSQVFVSPDATVRQLQRAVERSLDAGIRSMLPTEHHGVSWKSFWKSHSLSAHGVRLDDLNCSIREYNITSRTVLEFAKKDRDRKTPSKRKK